MDDAEFEFKCPECGRTLKTTVGSGRRNRSIRCPGGHTINVDGSGLDKATREAEKSLNKTLGRLR